MKPFVSYAYRFHSKPVPSMKDQGATQPPQTKMRPFFSFLNRQQPLFVRILVDFCNRITTQDLGLRSAYELNIAADLRMLRLESERFEGLERALHPLSLAQDPSSRLPPSEERVESDFKSLRALADAISKGCMRDMPRTRAIRDVSEGSACLPLTTLPLLPPFWDDGCKREIAVDGLGVVDLPSLEVSLKFIFGGRSEGQVTSASLRKGNLDTALEGTPMEIRRSCICPVCTIATADDQRNVLNRGPKRQ
jgi:hypothetical protein